jgi:Tfp pilus assembly protein PilN
MKSTPDLMLIPGQTGPEAWRVRGSEPAVQDSSLKGTPIWVALPTAHTISIPVRVLASDPAQRTAAVHLELEAAGISPEDLSAHRLNVVPLDTTGRDPAAAVFLSDGSQPADADLSRTLDSAYAPAACFHPLQVGTISLWQEQQQWIIGIPHENGHLLHAQALCSRELDHDAASEIGCVLASLELTDVLPRLDKIEIEQADTSSPPAHDFAEHIGLPLTFATPRAPRLPQNTFHLLPDAVVQGREDRSRQRMLTMSVSAIVLVLVAALSAFGARLYMREQVVIAERAVLDQQAPEVQAIRDAQQQFTTLDPTLNRDHFVVEMFYQLVNLLPPEGIRITRFEVRADSLIIDGEASSPQHAIDFRGELTGSDYFKDWGFDQGFSQNPSMQDGRATFRAEGRQNAPTEEDSELVAAQ